jgi:hypothetical protein
LILELFWQCGFLLFFFSFYYPFLLNPVFAFNNMKRVC